MSKPILHIKSYDDHRKHFIERLKQRHEIDFTNEDYDALCENSDVMYRGCFKKGADKSIGYVYLNTKKVWVLYSRRSKCFMTCYPESTDTDIYQMIKACFPKSLFPIAKGIYHHYEREADTVKTDFGTLKEAAIYYFDNTLFPNLHIENYKDHCLDPIRIMHKINSIILGRSPVKITLSKK